MLSIMVVKSGGTVKTAKHHLEIRTLYKDTSTIQQQQQAGNSSKASVEPNGTYENAAGLDTLPSKLLCRILSYLKQSELLSCRLIKKDLNHTIKSHFIFNPPLSDENLHRTWSPGVFFPWILLGGRNGKFASVTEKDVIYNKIVYLRVGKLVSKFQGSLQGTVCGTVEHVEFTQPVARRNINKIMKDCTACTTLTIHTSVFAGLKQIRCCCHCPIRRNKRPRYVELETVANQLRKLYIILDEATAGARLPCLVPYCLKISLNPPELKRQGEICQIHFIPQGAEDIPTEVHKTWIIDDQIIDLYSRPDCLRKLTYFSRTTQAELREIKVKFVPDLDVPATVQCAKMIHHPAFYPQLKKYPTGPFNGTILTYFTTSCKEIMTYRPVHLSASVLVMTFPDAALFLVSERKSAATIAQE